MSNMYGTDIAEAAWKLYGNLSLFFYWV
jgi:hypothetical protein